MLATLDVFATLGPLALCASSSFRDMLITLKPVASLSLIRLPHYVDRNPQPTSPRLTVDRGTARQWAPGRPLRKPIVT